MSYQDHRLPDNSLYELMKILNMVMDFVFPWRMARLTMPAKVKRIDVRHSGKFR